MSEISGIEPRQAKETLSGLNTPLLVLVQEPDPNLFNSDPNAPINVSVGEEMMLEGVLIPVKLRALSKVVYEPCLVSQNPIDTESLSGKMPGCKLELRRFLGHMRFMDLRQREQVDMLFLKIKRKL